MHQTTERLHAMDAVRAFALLAGVALHASATQASIDGEQSAALAAIFYFIHIFRMPVFFLVAGYFGRLLLERRGVKAFAKNRAKRIALPFAVSVPTIPILALLAFALGALTSGMSVDDLTTFGRDFAEQQEPSAHFGPTTLGFLAHLWFLYYLLMFYAAALVARTLTRDTALRGIDGAVRFLMRSGLAALAFALPVAAWYVHLWPEWPGWTGLPAPGSLIPFVPALIGYGSCFTVGWLLHRQTNLLLQLRDRWAWYSLAGIGLAVASYWIAGPTAHWSAYLQGWELNAFAATYMTASWCLSFALIGLGLRFLSNPNPARKYVADSSYWLYLMHLVPIMFFVAWLHPLDWHWGLKFTIIIAASVPLLLVSYHYLVRYTVIGATLNGQRHKKVSAGIQESLRRMRGTNLGYD